MKPMRPWSRPYKCQIASKDGVDFEVHVHSRPWSRKVGCLFVVGPDDVAMEIPEKMWLSDEGMSEVFNSGSWLELAAKVRAYE